MLCFSICTYAQNTIKFLGIPVDGTEEEMIAKLQAKGYEYNASDDLLYGEFNGRDVSIAIYTVNNRVWRIAVEYPSTDEANIKIRFNNLFDQFLNNGKYYCIDGNKLDDTDKISYEMTVNHKRYDAYFGLIDTSVNGIVWYTILEDFGKYAICIYYENRDNEANGEDL